MMRAVKFLLILAVLGFAGLVGYAYLGDIAPVPTEFRIPVTLDGA